MRSVRIAPSNSLLFISDPNGGSTPKITKGSHRMWSTPSCIAVGCLAFMDGETDVTLGSAQEVDPGDRPAFDGMLETPSKAIMVATVEHDKILHASVSNTNTRVRIWVNHPMEPDKIIIGLSS